MRWAAMFGLIVSSLVLDGQVAHARRSFVLFGAGETIGHRADLDDALRAQVAEELGLTDASIGYKYEYFGVFFFFDLLTFEGEYVLYEDDTDRYIPLDDEGLESLGTRADALGKPFLYHVPSGWLALLLVGGLWGFAKYRDFKTGA